MKLLTFDKYWQRGFYLDNEIYYKKISVELWSDMNIRLKCYVFENGLKQAKGAIMDTLKNETNKRSTGESIRT